MVAPSKPFSENTLRPARRICSRVRSARRARTLAERFNFGSRRPVSFIPRSMKKTMWYVKRHDKKLFRSMRWRFIIVYLQIVNPIFDEASEEIGNANSVDRDRNNGRSDGSSAAQGWSQGQRFQSHAREGTAPCGR